MINLIPPEAEQVLKREYIFRVGGTILSLIGATFLLLTIALVPTYVLISAQIHTSEKMVTTHADEAFQKADRELNATERLLEQFKKDQHIFHASVAIKEIEAHTPPGISFKSFTIVNHGSDVTTIEMRGQALSRESLALFKEQIEASEMFASAVVPIADLARDSNLPFSVTITLEAQTY